MVSYINRKNHRQLGGGGSVVESQSQRGNSDLNGGN